MSDVLELKKLVKALQASSSDKVRPVRPMVYPFILIFH